MDARSASMLEGGEGVGDTGESEFVGSYVKVSDCFGDELGG